MEINIGGGDSPIDESLFARADRRQVAIDIGMIAKMLALSSMMLPIRHAAAKEDSLYKYSQPIRKKTEEVTSDVIGKECIVLGEDGEYRRYYPNVPQELEKYVDCAAITIFKLIDGVMAARFAKEEDLSILQQSLEQIDNAVNNFNHQANYTHNIASVTIVDNDDKKSPDGSEGKKL